MVSPEHAINPPRQRRSQESFERVIRAGLEVLQERGFEGFTLQEVSRRANVSIGAIYARAPSREALILALHRRAMDDVAAQEREVLARSTTDGLTIHELIEQLVADLGMVMLGNADVLRVFMRRAPVEPEIWEAGAEHSQGLAEIFESALMSHLDELRHPDPAVAIDVAYRFVYCTLARRITHGGAFESSHALDDQRLIDELARAAADYLVGPGQ